MRNEKLEVSSEKLVVSSDLTTIIYAFPSLFDNHFF